MCWENCRESAAGTNIYIKMWNGYRLVSRDTLPNKKLMAGEMGCRKKRGKKLRSTIALSRLYALYLYSVTEADFVCACAVGWRWGVV